jgi:hypothetical protein
MGMDVGIGVNVFFNESWDHDAHIDLSYFYFVAAGFNNVFLYFALLPGIWAQYRLPVTCRSFVVQLCFRGLWVSPLLGYIYLWVYDSWSDKPPYALGVYEHAISTYQLVSCGVVHVLRWVLQPNDQVGWSASGTGLHLEVWGRGGEGGSDIKAKLVERSSG